jgi:hypothetical protein
MARGLGFGLLASACVALLDGVSVLDAAPASADVTPDYTALIMGDAFLSSPDSTYITQVMDTYIDPTTPFFKGQTVFPGATAVSQYTPETDYGQGLTQGVADLNQGITQYLGSGNDVVVFGYSESGAVATQEMINLAAEGASAPNASDLSFVLLEDLNNPDGGFFTRFPDMGLPATPGDTAYTTDIYSIEYSAASDFPQYYGNLMSDINAEDGYLELHPYLLADYPSTYMASELSGALKDANVSTAGLATSYYLIPTQDLPMLTGIQSLDPSYADMIQPDMRVLVDLGYDWTGNADVATAATLSNPAIDTTAVDAYLAAGADQGMIASLVDLGILPQSDLTGIADLYPYVPDVAGLEAGALTNDTLATADATESANLLASDLASSTSPFATELSAFLPGAASDLAGFFEGSLAFLSF